MLITCPNEKENTSHNLMMWKCYEKVVHGKTRACLKNKVLRLQYNEITVHVFFSYTRPRLQKFILHNFMARFQEEQYKTCLETFPPEIVMSIIDFVEMYTFMDFNEVQEMHWHSFQLTILVHIYYQWNPTYLENPNIDAKKLIIEYNYYIFL